MATFIWDTDGIRYEFSEHCAAVSWAPLWAILDFLSSPRDSQAYTRGWRCIDFNWRLMLFDLDYMRLLFDAEPLWC